MRGTCLCVVAVVSLTVSGTLVSGGGQDAGQEDLKKIQGTWQFLSQEMEGKSRPVEDVKKLKIVFTDDKWSVREDGKEVQAGTHKLDPTKKPAQLDAAVTVGEGKGTTMLGIYELKGDALKVNFDPEGKARPTGFSAKGSQFGAVLQREKKKP